MYVMHMYLLVFCAYTTSEKLPQFYYITFPSFWHSKKSLKLITRKEDNVISLTANPSLCFIFINYSMWKSLSCVCMCVRERTGNKVMSVNYHMLIYTHCYLCNAGTANEKNQWFWGKDVWDSISGLLIILCDLMHIADLLNLN